MAGWSEGTDPAPRVAVTGATGALGRRVVEQLGALAIPLRCDVTDREAVRAALAGARPTHLLHLAAVVDLSVVAGDEARVLEVNVGGTRNLGGALLELGLAPWWLYASSSHVYAPADGPIREDHPTAPRNLYGLTKLLGEQVAAHYADRARSPLCTARIFSLHDERQRGGFLVPATRRRLADRDPSQPYPVPNGDSVRDFSSAADLAGHLLALARAGAAEVVNVGSGRGRTVTDLLGEVIGPPWTFEAAPGGTTDVVVADTTRLQELTARG